MSDLTGKRISKQTLHGSISTSGSSNPLNGNVITRDSSNPLRGNVMTRGLDGKSAYEYAVSKGYEGTEEEFAEKLAADCVKKEDMPTQDDSLILVTELGLVTPIADDDNCVFTDENGVIYTL